MKRVFDSNTETNSDINKYLRTIFLTLVKSIEIRNPFVVSKNELESLWKHGKLTKRKHDLILNNLNQVEEFYKEVSEGVLNEEILVPLNGKTRKLQTVEDWGEAYELINNLSMQVAVIIKDLQVACFTAEDKKELEEWCDKMSEGCSMPCKKVSKKCRNEGWLDWWWNVFG